MTSKQEINNSKAKEIIDQVSTLEGRIILTAHMWYPLTRGLQCKRSDRSDETELEWAKRVLGWTD